MGIVDNHSWKFKVKVRLEGWRQVRENTVLKILISEQDSQFGMFSPLRVKVYFSHVGPACLYDLISSSHRLLHVLCGQLNCLSLLCTTIHSVEQLCKWHNSILYFNVNQIWKPYLKPSKGYQSVAPVALVISATGDFSLPNLRHSWSGFAWLKDFSNLRLQYPMLNTLL